MARSRPRSCDEPVWGLDVVARHDRYWQSRGVEIVRRGQHRVAPMDPGPYLLLGARDLYLGLLPIEMLRRRGPAIRLLTIITPADAVREHVECDDRGRLLGIRREYPSRTSRVSRRLLLTRDAALADAWQSSGLGPVWRHVRATSRVGGCRRRRLPGRVFDATHARECREFQRALLLGWTDPAPAVAGVCRDGPGIWIHETATVEAGARLVGPVWIGAGVHVAREAVIVGPAVLPDVVEIDFEPAAPARGVRRPRRSLRRSVPTTGLTNRLRRIFDVTFSAAALVATAPLYPLIMLAIWCEDGRPFFFTHRRQTTGGRDFVCYKFRTMCRDAETRREELAAHNLADGPQFHIPDDPRLLRVGRWLRRFHLDELPQFWNVLRGEMSVVGPRPSPHEENQCCPAWREARLSVRPGVTGLWQVSRTRAPQADFQEWIRYDLAYVRRRSWRLDLWIILRTIGKVFVR